MSMNITSGRALASTGSCIEPGYTQCQIAVWIFRIVPGIFLGFGTFGNVTSLVILWRRNLRKFSTTMYLSFLAVSDLTVLWASVVRNMVLFINGVDIRDISEVHCVANTWLVLASGALSSWILAMLTIERVMFTRFPTVAKLRMTRKFAFRLCLATAVIIALLHSPYFFVSRHTTSPSSNTTKCQFASTSEMKYLVDKVWPPTGSALFTVIPIVIIFAGNISIIQTLRHQRRRIQNFTSSSLQNGASRKNATGDKLVLMLSWFFLVTMTPSSVFYIVYRATYKTLTYNQFAWFQFAYSIVRVLKWSNFTFNFVLYFVVGSLFKKEWDILVQRGKVKLLRCFRRRETRVHPIQSVSSSLQTHSQASTSKQCSRDTFV